MKIPVYVPKTLVINDSDLPALRDRARSRHNLPADRPVPLRHIIEEARLAGLIELDRNYCVDLDFEEETPAKARRSLKRKRRPAKANGSEGRKTSHQQLPRA